MIESRTPSTSVGSCAMAVQHKWAVERMTYMSRWLIHGCLDGEIAWYIVTLLNALYFVVILIG